jgi:hypothetical protein
VSAAAKLDAANIAAKNRPERMHEPKAAGGFFKGATGGRLCSPSRVPFEIFLWSVLKTQPQTVECHFDASYDFTEPF